MTTYNLTIDHKDASENPVSGATVRVALNKTDYFPTGTVSTTPVTATTNASGRAVFPLLANTTGTQDSRYTVWIIDPITKAVSTHTIQMPAANSNLRNLVGSVTVEVPGDAENSANAAAASAGAASGSATAAAASAATVAANTSASATSATASSGSATAAATSATAAATSATAAASSATSAATDAATGTTNKNLTAADVVLTNADVVLAEADKVQTGVDRTAVAADLVATNQDTIDTAADLVLTNADVVLTHADVVSTAADKAAIVTLYDTFDDRYLGTKTSDPTVDNDGNALIIGAIYFNSSVNNTRFYNGSAWEDPEASTTANAATATTKASEAAASAAAALVSKNAADADLVSTNADVVLTHADVVLAEADKVQTGLDRVATAADVVSTNADVVITTADVVSTTANVATTVTNKNLTATDRTATSTSASAAATSATAAAASATQAANSAAGNWASTLANGNDTSGNDLQITTDDKVEFRDAAIYINSSTDGQLDIVADTEIQIVATTIDIDGAVQFTSISGTSATAVTDIDNGTLATGSATKLATQGAIKTYVDAQVGSADTLSEVLGLGNSSGGTNVVITAGDVISTNVINETTAATGVTIDSVLLKDNTVTANNGTFTVLEASTSLELATGATVTGIDDGGIATGSSTLLATQAAIKTYVDAVPVGTATSVGGTGTVNGITLTGTVTSSGNLVLGGALSGVNLASQITGTLPVANGGVGLTSAGTSGNVLTSDGTNWISSAPAAAATVDDATALAIALG